MKRSIAVILVVVVCVVFAVLLVGLGKGAISVLSEMGEIFGAGGLYTDGASEPDGYVRPNESDTGLKYTEIEYDQTEPFVIPPLNSGELDFEGLELTMLLPDTYYFRREWGNNTAEDELDEAIFMRNGEVKKELGLKIQYKLVPEGTDEYFELALNDVINAEHNYDIALNDSTVMSQLAYRGALSNMRDSESFPFLDLTEPCWSASATKNLTFGGNLYFTTGFFSTTMLDNMSVMFLNETIYNKNRESGDPDNLQIYASEGNWTYKEMYRLMSAFSTSMPNNDVLIIDSALSDKDILQSFAAAFDVDIMSYFTTSKKVNYGTIANARAEDVLTRTRELYSLPGAVVGDTAKFAGGAGIACEGIFFITKLYKDYETNFLIREMDGKYALMPLPKYDGAQEQYKAFSDGGSFIGILDNSGTDIQTHSIAVSAFVEATAEKSYNQILGYYFNRVVKPKLFGSDEYIITHSITVFDAMIKNIEFEFCNVYSDQLGGIGGIWNDAFSEGMTLEQAYNARVDKYRNVQYRFNSWIGQ
jgi:hypothetical protein